MVPDSFGNRTQGGFTAGFAGGDYVWLRAVAIDRPGPIGHEIGHNLGPGLGHANLLECSGPEPYDLAYSGCSSVEYLDPFDAMGWSERRGQMSAFHRELAGFFSSGNVLEVTKSGRYWLLPIERATPFYQALKIRRSPSEVLYLEYRRPIGYDARAIGALSGATDGAQIRTTVFGDGTTALIQPGGEFSLAPGRTYDAGTFTVTTLSSDDAGTIVHIEFR